MVNHFKDHSSVCCGIGIDNFQWTNEPTLCRATQEGGSCEEFLDKTLSTGGGSGNAIPTFFPWTADENGKMMLHTKIKSASIPYIYINDNDITKEYHKKYYKNNSQLWMCLAKVKSIAVKTNTVSEPFRTTMTTANKCSQLDTVTQEMGRLPWTLTI